MLMFKKTLLMVMSVCMLCMFIVQPMVFAVEEEKNVSNEKDTSILMSQVDCYADVDKNHDVVIWMECSDDLRRDLQVKVKFYNGAGHYMDTKTRSKDDARFLFYKCYCRNWVRAEVYFYVNGNRVDHQSIYRQDQ